jgi:hypothetical protein
MVFRAATPLGLIRFLFDQLHSSLAKFGAGWTTHCCQQRRSIRSPFLFGVVDLDINDSY